VTRPIRIAISAGEASGDRLGAGLARALRARRPDVEIIGMGGDEMAEAGVRLVQHASEVAVVGFVEVIRHMPAIRAAMARLDTLLREERPDVLVPIDFPDFNLRLAAKARAARVPVVYYVSPQVWAWRRGRVETIRELVRRMLVLFPFEATFYEGEGVPVTFVGHPAARERERASRAALLPRLGLDPARPVVALLPGSRVGEASTLFPILCRAAVLLHAGHPEVQCVVPKARTLPAGLLESVVARTRAPGIVIHEGDYPGVLEVADCGAVASGTATLDAALAGLPIVAVYRMAGFSYWIARVLVSVPHIALPNLIAGRRVVPELVQGECTPEEVAGGLAAYLDDPARAAETRRSLGEVRQQLAGDGAFERAADAVLAELDRKPV
jgi:lipid-A-disaccharide synthase